MRIKLVAPAALVALATATSASLLSAAPAHAGSYTYSQGISCGSQSPGTQTALVASGTFSSNLGVSGYTISWRNHRSLVSYTACGSAAPYGSYPINADKETLYTRLQVTSLTLESCKVSAKAGVSTDKDGNKTDVSVGAECSFGKKTAKEELTTTGKAKKASKLQHTASVTIAGTYCNAASLYSKATIVDDADDFDGVLTVNKEVYNC